MKKIQFKQHFATTFRCLTKKYTVLIYQSIILHILDRALLPKALASTQIQRFKSVIFILSPMH